MHILNVVNTVASGFMFVIWSKDHWYNMAFKIMFFTLMVFNIVNLAKN